MLENVMYDHAAHTARMGRMVDPISGFPALPETPGGSRPLSMFALSVAARHIRAVPATPV